MRNTPRSVDRGDELVNGLEHHVLGTPITDPFPIGLSSAVFGMGCFWGVERLFWEQEGVYTTVVGYAGGETPQPSYREVCSGTTGHAEVVLVIYDAEVINHSDMLGLFWENHDPTQGMRQGADQGSQYRSIVLCSSIEELEVVRESRRTYQISLSGSGHGSITTEVGMLRGFHPAEDHHQQYLSKNPEGYCALKGTGISCN